jgi:hypothetical protein
VDAHVIIWLGLSASYERDGPWVRRPGLNLGAGLGNHVAERLLGPKVPFEGPLDGAADRAVRLVKG